MREFAQYRPHSSWQETRLLHPEGLLIQSGMTQPGRQGKHQWGYKKVTRLVWGEEIRRLRFQIVLFFYLDCHNLWGLWGKRGCWSIPGCWWGIFGWSLHVLPVLRQVLSDFLPHSIDMFIGDIGDSGKLPVGVTVFVLVLKTSDLSSMYPALLSSDSWDKLQPWEALTCKMQ